MLLSATFAQKLEKIMKIMVRKPKKKKKIVEHPETQQKPTELQWTQSKRAGRMLCVSKIRGK